MPDTSDAQVVLQALYGTLDELRDVLKSVQADFRVQVAGASMKASPEAVAALRARYAQLTQQLSDGARRMPGAQAYFP